MSQDSDQHAADDADADAKDALDVVVTQQRAELDRLQHRADRIDTQAAAIMAGGTTVVGVAVTALAALHRHVDTGAIVLASVGGLSVGAAILVSLFAREPRFHPSALGTLGGGGASDRIEWLRIRWIVASYRFLERMVVRRGVTMPDRRSSGAELFTQRWLPRLEKLRAIGIRITDPKVPRDPIEIITWIDSIWQQLRTLAEDRKVEVRPAGTTGLEVRKNISDGLGVRIIVLDAIVGWREHLGRLAMLTFAGGMLALALGVAVTVA